MESVPVFFEDFGRAEVVIWLVRNMVTEHCDWLKLLLK